MRHNGFVAASDRHNERNGRANTSNGTGPSSAQQHTRGKDQWAVGPFAADANGRAHPMQRQTPCSVADMKARQVAKMREIRDALVAAGCASLDDQAAALGLSRSTTWTIMRGSHKSSGLSATILTRMLSAPRLQPGVRKKILEYIAEKSAGRYGTTKERLEKFIDRVRQQESVPGAETQSSVLGGHGEGR